MMMQVQPRRREVVIDGLLGDWIECGGGLVHHQNRGIGDKRSGYLDTLTLTAAEIAAPSLTWQS